MVVLGYLTALEVGLRLLVHDDLPVEWFDLLSATRRAKAEELYEWKRRENVAIGIEDCLYLADWLTITAKLPGVLERLGFVSKTSFERCTGSFDKLRNAVAHGGTMLDDDPLSDSIDRVRRVMDLTERTWAAAAELHVPWDAFAATIVTVGRRRLTGPRATPRWPYSGSVHVITAYNPGGIVRSHTANFEANEQLSIRLDRYGLPFTDVVGASADKHWQEPSFLIDGLTRRQAAALGAEFGQTAIFEIDADDQHVVACASAAVVRSVPRRRTSE
jgi:hypothetical protein